MEILHQILIESVSGGFCKFVGYWILLVTTLVIPLKLIIVLINRFLRHWNIRKHGYPPAHCDADGDFKNYPNN